MDGESSYVLSRGDYEKLVMAFILENNSVYINFGSLLRELKLAVLQKKSKSPDREGLLKELMEHIRKYTFRFTFRKYITCQICKNY